MDTERDPITGEPTSAPSAPAGENTTDEGSAEGTEGAADESAA